MTEVWEDMFRNNQELWGFLPARSTVLTNDLFVENDVKDVLIPGIGYGRNAQIFRDNGMTVTGIEISRTAIDLAHKNFGDDFTIHHGSVTDMPFDNNLYDGIYCYALIHFLDKNERAKLIQDCFNQLNDGGYMVFATVSKRAPIYGQGRCVDIDRFEISGGLKMFFSTRKKYKKSLARWGYLKYSMSWISFLSMSSSARKACAKTR